MPVTPVGYLALEMLHVENMIAASAMWRAVVAFPDADWPTLETAADAAAGTEEDARAAVIWEREDDASLSQGTDPDTFLPRAIIRHMTDAELTRFAGDGFDTQGMLMLEFELPIPTAYQANVKDALIHFLNTISRLEQEMAAKVITSPDQTVDVQKIERGLMGQIDPDEVNGQMIRKVEYFVSFQGTLL